MEVGHSNPTASHDNPPLHASAPSPSLPANAFAIDCIEVWRVSFPPPDERIGGGGAAAAGRRAGVLDAFKEDRNFLALAGKQMHSDGLR